MKVKLKHVIEEFRNAKVLVIGDAIIDTYVTGTIEKICREAPVPVFTAIEQKHYCGGAANTAINAATLGAEIYFLTVLGKDFNADNLLAGLRKAGVHTEFIIQDKLRITPCKKRFIASSNIILRVDEGSKDNVSQYCEEELLERLKHLHHYVDVIILSDYQYGVITNSFINSIKRMAYNKPIIIDSKDLSRFKTIKPTAVKPNYEEAIKLLHIEKAVARNRVEQIQAYGKRLLELTGADRVAVTLDADGTIYFEKGKKPCKIACIPCDNKNAIGAGDTFISAFGLSLACSLNGEIAAEIASAAAAVVLKKDGTVGCTISELSAYFDSTPKYVSNIEDLLHVVEELKKKGKKIVFTNGCFDILHKGHITLLNKAREAGDVLIVGVNGDESIRKIKGLNRPINNLKDRIAVLTGLQSVDYIIAFEETNPVHLIKAIRPNVFVKGGNYSEESIPEGELVKKLGGTIQIIPYVNDYSTSNLIKRIRDIDDEVEVEAESIECEK